ncbi:MAG: type IV secretion system protein, partial [Patescibacteria group bacterium]|nr:type IV secretion system protein [Patescibacteria group bacterium]
MVTLFFIVAVGIFAIPGLSYANTCTPSGGAGVDQGANMYTCTGGLSVSFNPAQPKLGDTVNFTIGLMNSTDQNDFKSMGADLQIWFRSGSWFSQDQSIFTKSFTGNTIQDKFIAGGSAFSQAGSYTLHIEMSYQVTGAISQMYSFAQDNQITVLAADNTGGPKLNVTASESFADGPNITKGLSWSYSDGGSGKQAASYKVDCGDSKGMQNVPSGQTSFRCVYGTNAQNYTAKVYAYDASGTQLAVQGATLTVTGNESTQGAGQNGTSTDTTLGGAVKGLISLVVGFVLGIIQELIYGIFYLLIVPLMQAMLSIRTYTDTFASVIYPGWVVLRNLCNIIFIVAIMVIAMGTLLRVDSYKSRSVLVQLILAALLVNFSLVIGQVVLGLADTVQNQFLPNNQDVIRALGKDLMVAYRSDVFNLKLTGYFSDIVKQIMFLILACGSFMVFLAIAAFLFIRIIMLWILLMLSPLAYAAGALPSTAHYRTEWWTTFLKYAFFTPIMAFFLNMTAIISNTYKTNPIFGTLGVKDSDFGDSSLAGFVFRVGSTLLLIVFLIVALKVAESFSIFGAGEISKFAKGGMFFPLKAAKVGAGMVERTYAKNLANAKEKAEESGQKNKARALRALQFLSPTTVKEAWKQRQHELHEEAFLGATGDVRDTLNRVMPTEWNQWSNLAKGKLPHLGRRTKYGLIGRRQLINIKKKEWENIPASEEEKVELESQAVHPEDMEAWNLNLLEGRHEDGRRIALLAKRRQEKEDELFETYKQQGIEERAARIRAQKEVRDENNENYVAVEYDAIRDL